MVGGLLKPIPAAWTWLDVARLRALETGPEQFCVRVRDPLCPWNEGRWALDSVEGRLAVESVAEADCELGIQAVAALACGMHDPADFVYRGWGDPSPLLQETMRTMFPLRLPYLHERL
jgi:hypothetical protein